MRRITACILVFIVLIGLCVWEQTSVNIYLENVYNMAKELQILTLDDETINTTEILEKVEHLEEMWESHESILCLFANHKDMKDLSIEIEKMKGNVEMNQYEDFQASLNVVMFLSTTFHHFMGFSFQNIF